MPRKPIPGYEGVYEADTRGWVWRIDGTFLRQLRGTLLNGYVQVNLCMHGVRKSFYMHQIIARTFIGPPPEDGMQVNHKNRNKQDNRACNLEYKTPREHSKHTLATGHRTARGESHTMAILSNRTVLLIRRAASERIPIRRIALILGVSKTTIYHIVARTRWRHLENETAPTG